MYNSSFIKIALFLLSYVGTVTVALADTSVTSETSDRSGATNAFSTCTKEMQLQTASGCTGDGWFFLNGANSYCNISHPPHGSGCVAELGGTGGALIQTRKIYPIQPGKTYTFSFYMQVDQMPQGLPQVFGQFYDASGNNTPNQFFERQSVTVTGQWQEVVFLFKAPDGTASVRPTISMDLQTKNPAGTSTFLISDAFLAPNIIINDSATTKVPFNGSRVHIDSLGNFQVFKNGTFADFFPICIFADMRRPGLNTTADWWQNYANQGFNCNMWAGYPQAALRGQQNGLWSGYQIAGYMDPANTTYYNQPGLLTNAISGTSNSLTSLGALDSLLFYYWDNEKAEIYEWNTPANIAAAIDAADRDSGNNRMHPIYSLQGHTGLARKYNIQGVASGSVPSALSDTVGTYVRYNERGTAATNNYTQALGHILLNNLQAQNQPVSIAQFNSPDYEGLNFRAAVYTAIANGAKGIGYWKDCVPNSNTALDTCLAANNSGAEVKPVNLNAWWSELPVLAATIQSQLPIIRKELATTWHLTKTSTGDNVQTGTRTYQGKGYIIASNESPSDATATYTLSGLGYTPTAVINAFSKDSVASVASGSFSLPLRANDGGFFILGDNFSDSLALNLQFTGNLDDSSAAHNSNGALVGGSGAIYSGNALSLSGGFAQIPSQTPAVQLASPSLEMNNDLTIIARVNINTSQTGYAGIVTKGAGDPHTAGYAFFYDASVNKLRFCYGRGGAGSGDRNTLATATLPTTLMGAWHTVGVTATLAGSVRFYVDGNEFAGSGTVNTESANTMVNRLQPLQVGAWYAGHYLQGSIDNVRIYKAALTKEDIQNGLRLGIQSSTSNSRYDVSVYGNDVISTSYTWNSVSSSSNMIGFQPASGGIANNQIVADNIASSLELDANTDLSISARVQIYNANNTGHAAIIAKGATGPTDPGYVLTYNTGTNQLGFWPCCAGTAVDKRGYFNSAAVILNDGAVHDVVVTFSRGSSGINFYVDGVAANPSGTPVSVPSTFSTADFTHAGAALQIGSWAAGNYLSGGIANVFIDRRVLTPTEIQQRHNFAIAPPSP
jgi:concanavalin A-like lectin/glucanase superfamily protein/carbohydrate binding protein with CBM4/9 domain